MDETYYKEFYGRSSKKIATTKTEPIFSFFPKKKFEGSQVKKFCPRDPKQVILPSPISESSEILRSLR